MSYKEFYNAYNNNDLGTSVFLYGTEDFLIEWAEKLIIDKYVEEEYRHNDVVEFDGESVEVSEIFTAAMSYSMFSDKRVIVVKNYPSIYKKSTAAHAAEDEMLLELAGEKQDSCILIFLLEAKYYSDIKAYGKKLSKLCRAYEFSGLDRSELRSWINKRVRSEGKLIGRKEADYIIDVSGYCLKNSDYDLKRLAADITKICGAEESDTVSSEIIDDLLVGADDKFVFNYIDALMNGNKSLAMEMTTVILRDDDAAMQLISLVTKQFEIMYDSLELSEKGMSIAEMAKATGVNEFRFKKAYQAARAFSLVRIKELLINLYNTDRDIKSGNIDRNIAFELFTACV